MTVEQIPGMLGAGDTPEIIIEGNDWLEMEDIQACLAYAYKLVENERVEPLIVHPAA